MSQENVEIVRRAWQAFVSGGVEATFDFWTEDCVFEEFPEMPESPRARAFTTNSTRSRRAAGVGEVGVTSPRPPDGGRPVCATGGIAARPYSGSLSRPRRPVAALLFVA